MKILCESTGSTFEVDEKISIGSIRSACPNFFKTPHGRRETVSAYRGCLIVRNTVAFGGVPVRKTTAYLYDTKSEDTFCINPSIDLGSVRDAKKLIDFIVDGGLLK